MLEIPITSGTLTSSVLETPSVSGTPTGSGTLTMISNGENSGENTIQDLDGMESSSNANGITPRTNEAKSSDSNTFIILGACLGGVACIAVLVILVKRRKKPQFRPKSVKINRLNPVKLHSIIQMNGSRANSVEPRNFSVEYDNAYSITGNHKPSTISFAANPVMENVQDYKFMRKSSHVDHVFQTPMRMTKIKKSMPPQQTRSFAETNIEYDKRLHSLFSMYKNSI